MLEYYCPNCGGKIDIPDNVKDGEIVSCPSCGGDFSVKIEMDGISLQESFIEGEDWGE